MFTLSEIPQEKRIPMALRSQNQQTMQYPELPYNITINNYILYNYVLRCLSNDNYHEAYTIIKEFKKMIRCIWRTYYDNNDLPDAEYLNNISTIDDYDIFIQPNYNLICKTYEARTKRIEHDDLILFERSLLPSYPYDFENFKKDNTLWDEYLLIFDNILLSEIVELRKQLMTERDKKFAELSEEFSCLKEHPKGKKSEEYFKEMQRITDSYRDKIDTSKEKIFSIVNYLNWLFYEGNDKNKRLALSVVLLRYSAFNQNELFDETKQHEEQDLIYAIKERIKENNLLELYLLINVYNYEFIHKSLAKYDTDYIAIMINYSLHNLISLDDFKALLIKDIENKLPLLKLVCPIAEQIELIKNTYITGLAFNMNNIYNLLINNYSDDLLRAHDVHELYKFHRDEREIIRTINAITDKTAFDKYRVLDKFDSDNVYKIIMDKFAENKELLCATSIINYLLLHFPRDKIKEDALNKVVNPELLGLFSIALNDIEFYNKSQSMLSTIRTIGNNYNKCSKEYINEILPLLKDRLQKETGGYNKFTIEDVITKLEENYDKAKTTEDIKKDMKELNTNYLNYLSEHTQEESSPSSPKISMPPQEIKPSPQKPKYNRMKPSEINKIKNKQKMNKQIEKYTNKKPTITTQKNRFANLLNSDSDEEI